MITILFCTVGGIQMKDNNLNVIKMERSMIDECVDLYMNTFSKEPWYDEYESKEQVVKYFESFFNNNYFCGYVGMLNNKIVAISVGMKKPWINGIEYYIDEFCVDYDMQGKGIGSSFIKGIEEDILKQGMNGMILNTEKDFPSYNFYIKNGFDKIDNLVVLGK